MNIPAEVVERGPRAVEIFRNVIRKNGEGAYRGAVMLALQEPPRANTDREFTMGDEHGGWLNSVGPLRRKRLLAAARKLGIDPAARIYKSGLGPPTDPRAWIESRGDILRTAREKKLVIESDDATVNYEPPEAPPKESLALAPDIVNRFVAQKLSQEPGLAEKVKRKPSLLNEVKASVVDAHASQKKRKRVKG